MPSAARKSELRRAARAQRAARPAAERAAAGRALAGWAPAIAARRVTAYIGVDDEPATLALVEALAARGVEVLLPITRADLDLEWAPFSGAGGLVERGAFRLLEPTAPSLGLEAIAGVELVLAPALAIARDGARLGQGGGCYDRALARTTAPVIAIVYDDELVDELPVEPHDRRVGSVLLPSAGIVALG